MERGGQDSPQASPNCSATTQSITCDPRHTGAELEAWEKGEGAQGHRLFSVNIPFPAQCPDLSLRTASLMATWASGLRLYGAKWPEAQG